MDADPQQIKAMVDNLEALAIALRILIWILGVALLPLIGWALHLTWTIKILKWEVHELLIMHKDPDAFGFGTKQTNNEIEDHARAMESIVKDNTTAMKTLAHYIQWLGKHQTGETPPPPVLNGD